MLDVLWSGLVKQKELNLGWLISFLRKLFIFVLEQLGPLGHKHFEWSHLGFQHLV